MARLARAPDGSRFAQENTAKRAPERSTDGVKRHIITGRPGRLRVVVSLLCLVVGVAAAAADEVRCRAPERVCAVRDQVFRIASFDPVGSAVLVEAGLLVTNRHVIADRSRARVFLSSGRVIEAFVVPTSYPGDLVLLRADGLKNRLAPEIATAEKGAALYTVGTDLGSKRIRVYPPGRVILPPAKDRPLARIHHSTPSFPGNSGGALVDDGGRLVGIVTSGGEGLNEAIPASELRTLRALSGPLHAERSRELGIAYRICIEGLERARSRHGPTEMSGFEKITAPCSGTGNRQLFDLAAQVLAKARRFDAAIDMFERALGQDPNALNSRLGLVVTFNFAGRYTAAIPHLTWLLRRLPENLRVLRLSIQAGKRGDDMELARRALERLERYYPRFAPGARKFLEYNLPVLPPSHR